MRKRREELILALIAISQLGFRSIAGIDLGAQLLIEIGKLCGSSTHFPLQLRGASQLHGMRHHLEQCKRGGDGNNAGDALERAGQTIFRMPDRPNFHQVGRSTQDDERGEHQNDARVGDLFASLMNQVIKSERDGVIGQCNQGIRGDIEP